MAKLIWIVLFSTFSWSSFTFAATYINFTRLIVNQKDSEVTFIIKNTGAGPVLMQVWTDTDNIFEKPEKIKTPFLIQPPVFRLNSQESRTLRMQLAGNTTSLPTDRESLFWLNALEVPQKPAVGNNTSDNSLQIAFRTRIKVFYRPTALGKQLVENEVKNLTLHTAPCENLSCIEITNPTPFHFTLLSITLNNGKKVNKMPQDGMIQPKSSMKVSLDNSIPPGVKITAFSWVDDYGVENTHKI